MGHWLGTYPHCAQPFIIDMSFHSIMPSHLRRGRGVGVVRWERGGARARGRGAVRVRACGKARWHVWRVRRARRGAVMGTARREVAGQWRREQRHCETARWWKGGKGRSPPLATAERVLAEACETRAYAVEALYCRAGERLAVPELPLAVPEMRHLRRADRESGVT